MTQIAPTKTARGVSARTAVASVVGTALFGRIVGRIDRVAFLAFLVFFAGTGILLSESFRSFRSAESSYRIDRGGFDGLFTRTDTSSGDRWIVRVSEEQRECPCQKTDRRSVTQRRNAGCLSNR